MSNLTLIIPARNEAESLPYVLEELKKFDYNISIVLKSNDFETINSIKNFDVKIIYQDGDGYGDALIQGINYCETDYFAIFNADGSFDPNEINKMLNLSKNDQFDLVFGSRYQENSGSEDDTLITFIGNYFFTYFGKIFFNLKISDILYTFVIGKTKKIQELGLKKKDFCLCVELPIKAKRNNLNMISTSSFERKRIAGKKKVNAFLDGYKILSHMIKLLFIR